VEAVEVLVVPAQAGLKLLHLHRATTAALAVEYLITLAQAAAVRLQPVQAGGQLRAARVVMAPHQALTVQQQHEQVVVAAVTTTAARVVPVVLVAGVMLQPLILRPVQRVELTPAAVQVQAVLALSMVLMVVQVSL
jgi:hypothetical protein